MGEYIIRRILLMIPTLFVISVISFVIIQLPPGDFLTSYIATLESSGQIVDQAAIDGLRDQYGLGEPVYVQYCKWISGHAPGRLRPVVPVEPAGLRADRGAAGC